MEIKISNEIRKRIYQTLYLIRFAEEQIIKFYPEDEMKTPMHMSVGSEAISTGVCCALNKDDQVFGTYRSHALFLAKTNDTDDFFAEMYGKDTAFLKGRGGSMHMCAPHYGFMGTSAIVGSIIPVAVGAAFANKQLNNNRTVAVFFGDGAINEGCFWESLNSACLMKVPIVFVCEDNNYAVHVKKDFRNGFTSFENIVKNFDCNFFSSDSTNAEEIYKVTLCALESIKNDHKPAFLHFKYYRYLEHVGVNRDFDKGYRSEEEFAPWRKIDPIDLYRNKIVNYLSEEDILDIEDSVTKKVMQSIKCAKEAKLSSEADAYFGVFV